MTHFDDPLASKKEDPNFSQLSGHVPSELARQFRIACADQGLKVSEGVEQAIACWLTQLGYEVKSANPTQAVDKGGE